jgi:hypothetical protein
MSNMASITHTAQPSRPVRQRARFDSPNAGKIALWGGIIFSFAFTALIYIAGPALLSVPHAPDQGASWYYWKLIEPTTASRLSAWGLYLAHQFALWGLIFYAQKLRPGYTKGLHTFNIIALGVNALFVGLHFVQTHVWYDGLAQDVSIFSSQGSVIVMLIVIMLMESRSRGLIFGKRLPVSQRIVGFARKYHGYFFAWAIVYTFWYHPMEATSGHLVGFFYTFLLMLQGSLFFTRIHVNRYWMFVMEITVLAHGTLVAIVQGNGIWPMFFFGFAGIFVITQMWGLGLKAWMRWGLLLAYIGGIVIVYSSRGLNRLWEPLAIPLIDYAGVLILAGAIGGGLWVYDRIRQPKPAITAPTEAQ